MKQEQVDIKYLKMAHIWAENSTARKLHVGALIVKDKMIISDGYNGTPCGFDNNCEIENEDGSLTTKVEVLHAEANAITKVAKSTQSCENATLYCTDSPCIQCAKLIIQAGISRLVYDREYHKTEGLELLAKAGIKICHIPLS